MLLVLKLTEEQIKSVWCLQNFSSVGGFEMLIIGSGCIVEVMRGRDAKIELFFYLEKNPPASNGDRYASLCCKVLNGGDGRPLSFTLQVVDLDVDLKTKKKDKYKFCEFFN